MIAVYCSLYNNKPTTENDISFYIMCFFNQIYVTETCFQRGQQGMCSATINNNWNSWLNSPAQWTENFQYDQNPAARGRMPMGLCVSHYVTQPRLSTAKIVQPCF